MKNNTKIAAVLDQLLEKHIAFAAWFFPQDSRMGLLAGNASDVEFFSEFNRLNGEAGFVFAPFRITDQSPVILLKPKVYLEDFYAEDQLDIDSLEPFSLVDPIIRPVSREYNQGDILVEGFGHSRRIIQGSRA